MGLLEILQGKPGKVSHSNDYVRGYDSGRWDASSDQRPADIWGGNSHQSAEFQRGYSQGFDDFDILNDED